MPINTFVTAYRDETVIQFEQSMSKFRMAAAGSYVGERVIQGDKAIILVGGSGGAEATTRGVNSLIPARKDSYTPTTVQMSEWHDLVENTKFDVFSSQGSLRDTAQKTTVAVINRKIDDVIIDALDTATLGASDTPTTATLDMFADAATTLAANDVDVEQENSVFAAVTPKTMRYLIQIPEFASSEYVDVKPVQGPIIRMRNWLGINFFMSTRLPGVGTSNETNFVWHRDSIGFADNREGLDIASGYDEKQALYWTRASMTMGAALLQNNGVVKVPHIGNA